MRALYAAIRSALAAYEPRIVERVDGDDSIAGRSAMRAAVAAVLRESPRDEGGADLLFILRARSERDPWSGHIGLPGGRIEAGDASVRTAAERETLEELGLDLSGAEFLGRLDDVQASSGSIIVSPFAYALRGALDPELVLDAEIAEAFWMPFTTLLDPARQTTHRLVLSEREVLLRAIRFDEPHHPLLWGLTYRIVEQLFHLAGRALPDEMDARERAAADRATDGARRTGTPPAA